MQVLPTLFVGVVEQIRNGMDTKLSTPLSCTFHDSNRCVADVMADNGIGDEGAKALAEALQTNNTLQMLDLSCT